MASASQPQEDNWASWDDAPAADPTPASATNEAEDWAAFDNNQAASEPMAEATLDEQQAEAGFEPASTEGLRQYVVLYNFDAQNSDELTINENEMVFISEEECDEEGWVVCINSQGQKGYVPLNYLDFDNVEAGGAESTEGQAAGLEANGISEAKSEVAAPVSSDPYVDPFASSVPAEPIQDDDNWGAFPNDPTPTPAAAAPPPAPAPAVAAQPSVPTQPPPMSEFPPWQSYEDEANSSDLSDDDSDVGTEAIGPPPSDIPPPIPDCPPPISEFTSCASISFDNR